MLLLLLLSGSLIWSVTLLESPPALGQDAGEKPIGPEPPPDNAKEPLVAEKTATPSKSTKPDASKVPKVAQVSFKGAKIDHVMKWLNETTGKHLIKHPKVNCQLTVMSSKASTVHQAKKMVYHALELEGFVAVETRNAIYIVPAGESTKIAPEWLEDGAETLLEGKQSVIQPFKLAHVEAAQLAARLPNVLSGTHKIDVDSKANRIIIVDSADHVRLARELIKELDVPSVGDSITEVFTLGYAKAEKIAAVVRSIYAGGAAPSGK